MKAYYYGPPDFKFLQWAFNIRNKWRWTRFIVVVPVAIIIFGLMPFAFIFVSIGRFGHWIASGIGISSHEHWE